MKKILLPLFSLIIEGGIAFAFFTFQGDVDKYYVYKNVIVFLFCLAITGHYKASKSLFSSEALILIKGHLVFLLFSVFVLDWNMETKNLIIAILLNALFVVGLYISCLLVSVFLRFVFKKASTSKVVIVGVGNTAKKIYETLTFHTFSSKKPLCFVDINDAGLKSVKQNDVISNSDIEKECKVYKFKEIDSFLKHEKPEEAIIAISKISNEDMILIENAVRGKVNKIMYVPSYKNVVNFASRIEEYDGLIMIESLLKPMSLFSKILKRTFDIILSSIGCILLLPLMLFVKIGMICTKDNGPLFFMHKRIGRNGKEFKVIKFRTMRKGAEEELEKLLNDNPELRKEYELNKKLKEDPRVTKFGTFLRKSKIDEFPQFLNIFVGQMSFVGPRPVPYYEIKDNKVYYDLLIKMRPGLTGMWQAISFKDTTLEARLRYDEFYYNNYSIWIDFKIVYATVINLIRGRVTW